MDRLIGFLDTLLSLSALLNIILLFFICSVIMFVFLCIYRNKKKVRFVIIFFFLLSVVITSIFIIYLNFYYVNNNLFIAHFDLYFCRYSTIDGDGLSNAIYSFVHSGITSYIAFIIMINFLVYFVAMCIILFLNRSYFKYRVESYLYPEVQKESCSFKYGKLSYILINIFLSIVISHVLLYVFIFSSEAFDSWQISVFWFAIFIILLFAWGYNIFSYRFTNFVSQLINTYVVLVSSACIVLLHRGDGRGILYAILIISIILIIIISWAWIKKGRKDTQSKENNLWYFETVPVVLVFYYFAIRHSDMINLLLSPYAISPEDYRYWGLTTLEWRIIPREAYAYVMNNHMNYMIQSYSENYDLILNMIGAYKYEFTNNFVDTFDEFLVLLIGIVFFHLSFEKIIKKLISSIQSNDKTKCNFCKKGQHETDLLIKSEDTYICGECTYLCVEIVKEKGMNKS